MMNTFSIPADIEKQIKIVGGEHIAIANKGPGAAFISEKSQIKAGEIGVTCVEPGTTEYLVIPTNYEYVKDIDKFDYVSRVFVTTSSGEDVNMECAAATTRPEVMAIVRAEVDTSTYETEDSDMDQSGNNPEPNDPTPGYEWAIYCGCLWSSDDSDGVHSEEVNVESITEWFTSSNPDKTAPVSKFTDKSGAVKCGGNNGYPIFMWDSRMGDCSKILNAISADAKTDCQRYTVTIEDIEYIVYVQNGTADMSDDVADFTVVF